MPVDPTVDSIVNKGYVDTGLSAKADSATTLAGYGITDGVVKGHEVIAFQAPTAQNNYTWYRKYADGWVEQGGYVDTTNANYTATFPVEMADTNYTIQVSSRAWLYNQNNNYRTKRCKPKRIKNNHHNIYRGIR